MKTDQLRPTVPKHSSHNHEYSLDGSSFDIDASAKNSNSKFLFFIIIIAMSFFVPGYFIPGIGTIWIADLIVGTFLIYYAIVRNRDFSILFQHPYFRYYLYMLIWLSFVSIVSLILNYDVTWQSLFSSLAGRCRPFLYLITLFFLMPAKNSLEKYINVFVFVFIIEAVLAYFQQNNTLDINTLYSLRFRIGESRVDEYIYITGSRVMGTFGNPNDFGTYLSIASCFFVTRAVFSKNNVKSAFYFILFAIALSISIFLAQTRQGTLLCMIGGLSVFALGIKYRKFLKSPFLLLILILFVMYLFSNLILNESLHDRFSVLTGEQRIMTTDSMYARIISIPEIVGEFGLLLLSGVGIGGMITRGSVDCGWLSILIIGGVPMVVLFIFWSLAIPKYLFRRTSDTDVEIFVTLCAMMIVVFLTQIVNNIFNNTLIMLTWGFFNLMGVRLSFDVEEDKQKQTI